MIRLLCLVALLSACTRGKTLELQLSSGCDLSTATTVRIETTLGTTERTAAEVFAGSATPRLLLLLPEATPALDVTVRVLDGTSERASGTTRVDFDGPGNYTRALPLTGPGCATPPDLTAIDLTAPPDLSASPDMPCGVLRLTGGSANAASQAFHNPPGSFTVEAWVYRHIPTPPPTPVNYYNIVGHWGVASLNTGSWALFTDDSRPVFGVTCDGTVANMTRTMSTTQLQLDRWTHIAGVFNATNQRVYLFVDGQLIGSNMAACNRAVTNNQPFQIAYNDPEGGDEFLGDVDDVRLTTGARYAGPFTPDHRLPLEAETLALYHFDADGADSSTANNPMVPSGAAAFADNCR
jgi:hypothetical protein